MNTDFLTRSELFAQGHTRRSIAAAVRLGSLIHIRRDRYLLVGSHDMIARAVRVGGRLTCLSLLALLEIFVLETPRLHVHVGPRASRLRSPHDRTKHIDARHPWDVRLHWTQLAETPASTCVVHIVDALIHAVRCQPPRAAIATLDSAINRGIVTSLQIAEVFAALPARFQALRPFIDGRAQSGPETLVRLMARQLGCDIRLQVGFAGIGYVDLLLDGWLVVECDSKQFHADWEQQVKDRERDLALAALGYPTLRITAAMIMYRPDEVFAALQALIESRRAA